MLKQASPSRPSGRPSLARWLLAGSLLSGACGPSERHPEEPVAEADAGPVDSGESSGRCSGVPRQELNCQSPIVGRIEDGKLVSAGAYFLAMTGMRYSGSGMPTPMIAPVTEACVFLAGRTVPEGTFSDTQFPDGTKLSYAVRMGAPDSSEDKWAVLQVQDGSCRRNCEPGQTITQSLAPGEMFSVSSPGATRSVKLENIDGMRAIATVFIPDGDSGWRLHVPQGSQKEADFWTTRLNVRVSGIGANAERADIQVEAQECPLF